MRKVSKLILRTSTRDVALPLRHPKGVAVAAELRSEKGLQRFVQ